MSFFLTCLRDELRARATRWKSWLVLLLLPMAACAVARLLPAEEVSTPVQVGVVLPKEGGGIFWEKLEERSGLAVVFLPAEPQQARRQVAAGRWDCALVLPEDFAQRLERLETEGLFTLLTGPGSAAYPLVRETVAACAAECLSSGMAEQYLLDSGILDKSEIEAVRPRLRKVLEDQERVHVTMETVDGHPLEPLVLVDTGVSGLLSGLAAVLLMVWALFTAMDLGRWLDGPFARRLAPLRGRTALLLPKLAGALVPALCAGALALLAARCPAACILPLVPYLLFWGTVALALARWRPAWSALPVLMPFVPVLGLLLSPVLLDISLLFPGLGPVVRWMPVTLYLRACGGSWEDGLALAAGAAVILAVLLALDQKRT